MRSLATGERIRELMRRLGACATTPTRIFLTGGATAVLIGWRESTVDVDIKIVPDSDELLRAVPALKEALDLNIELASPADFIPPPPDWESQSPFVAREGRIDFHHFDFRAQALAKIERGHAHDLQDVDELIRRGLVEPARLREYFERIKPDLYRYPALNPAELERRVSAWADRHIA